MRHLDIVYILLRAVAGVSHVPYDISRRDSASLRKPLRIRIVLPEMRIVIIPSAVEAADADAPAAVLVPAQRLDSAGLDSRDRCSHESHHVVAEVLSLVAVATADTEVIVMTVIKAACQREITL